MSEIILNLIIKINSPFRHYYQALKRSPYRLLLHHGQYDNISHALK